MTQFGGVSWSFLRRTRLCVAQIIECYAISWGSTHRVCSQLSHRTHSIMGLHVVSEGARLAYRRHNYKPNTNEIALCFNTIRGLHHSHFSLRAFATLVAHNL